MHISIRTTSANTYMVFGFRIPNSIVFIRQFCRFGISIGGDSHPGFGCCSVGPDDPANSFTTAACSLFHSSPHAPMETDGLYNLHVTPGSDIEEILLDAPSPTALDLDAITSLLRDYAPLPSNSEQEAAIYGNNADFIKAAPSRKRVSSESDSFDDDDGATLLRMRPHKKIKTFAGSRKDEIGMLRGEVRELQKELQRLVEKLTRSELVSEMGTLSSHSQSLWQRVAHSQLELRRKSEAESEALREMVAIQILEAKNLRRILKRRTRIERQNCAQPPATPPPRQCAYHRRTVERCRRKADQIDKFFTAKGIEQLSPEGDSRNVNMDAEGGVYFEILQRRYLPFDIKHSEKAMWKALRRFGMDAKAGIRPYHVKEGDEILQLSFFAAISGVADLVGADTQKVVRQYKGDDRFVFILNMQSESIIESHRSGVRDKATMQIVLEKTRILDEAEEEMTEMKLCFTADRNTPLASDPSGPVAVAAWDELVPQLAIDVESSLLDGTVMHIISLYESVISPCHNFHAFSKHQTSAPTLQAGAQEAARFSSQLADLSTASCAKPNM
ncbi:hypothetical protein PHYSODRAFT_305547 [Phytophthora sojae]|uniref:Uncharacterized protein n=1 Tax=Phytophthora sojae (strain P6497) TaxID=1094619 RepID=G5A5J5_PHYSP|nr:hypothetical protein PHYSODRAFT_305547 [Phytophthora sojae]EGZ08600.1 hypothetical protein PHYSODRAFT_305547 [Phytophthora sojae]|eukprot:XP_009535233.1 hypothetical protein PHYSODRAFT_305547 [Phytophthora sojae]